MKNHCLPVNSIQSPVSPTIDRTPMQKAQFSIGLAIVQLILAYEWLVSGINKFINPNFTAQLGSTLHDGMKGNPYGFYDAFLRAVVLPHAVLLGVLTEVGEVVIGVTLLGSAALWIIRPRSRYTPHASAAAAAALAGSAFLSLNYFLQGGSPVPWINPANAFSEGVDIDILIPLLAVTLLVANLQAVHRPVPAPARNRSTGKAWIRQAR